MTIKFDFLKSAPQFASFAETTVLELLHKSLIRYCVNWELAT